MSPAHGAGLPAGQPAAFSGSPDARTAASTIPVTAAVGAPMTLDALAQLAAGSHALVAARRAAVHGADADTSAARQQYLPTPAIQTQQGRDGLRTTSLSLQLPLWTGGRIAAGVDSALARARASRSGVAEAQQRLAVNVTGAYQDFALARAREEALKRFLARLERYRSSMERRVGTGVSPTSDLELLRARQSTALAQLNAAGASADMALAQLSSLVGMPLRREEIAAATPAPALAALPDLLGQAERFSPTLRRMAREIEAARSDAAGRKAAMSPTLAAVVQRNIEKGIPNAMNSTSLMLQLQYTPGAGLSALSQARAAEAQVEVVRLDREAARTELARSIRSEYAGVQAAAEREHLVQQNADAAAAVLASYERLFIAGKRSWLDVMNAARELSEADAAVADLAVQRVTGRYRLALYAGEPGWMDHTDE